MKGLLLTKILPAFLIVLFMAGWAQAGNTVSIAVSCSIPVMPGLNVPLIEEEKIRTQADEAKTEEKPETQKEAKPMLIQQDTEEEKETTEYEKTTVIVKTFYSR